MPGTYCKFKNCKNNAFSKNKKRFYRFPKDEDRCRQWIELMGSPDLSSESAIKCYTTYRLCEDHFSSWCFMNAQDKQNLVKNALPFTPNKPTIVKENTVSLSEDSLSEDFVEDAESCDQSSIMLDLSIINDGEESNTSISDMRTGFTEEVVKMEDIDDLLRTNIHSILDSVSDETVNNIIQAVKDVGLVSLSDLQFVQEEDLKLVLKPIPRRKLIKAWSNPTVLPSASQLPAPHSALDFPRSPPLPLQRIFANSSLDFRRRWTKRFTMLQTYIKYKREFSSPNTDERHMWRKIAKEVREKCSLNCGTAQCRYKIDKLRSLYERIKNKNGLIEHAFLFLNEGRKAFETAENSVTPNPQIEDKINADSNVAPIMRRTNRRGESMASSHRDEAATVRVKNLSENVRHSDLQKLFRPFGTIARIYITKDKLTGLPKGVAFIKYRRREDASKAIDIDGFKYDSRILSVEWARGS